MVKKFHPINTVMWLVIFYLAPDHPIKGLALAIATMFGVLTIFIAVLPMLEEWKAKRLQTRLNRTGYQAYKMEVKDPFDEI